MLFKLRLLTVIGFCFLLCSGFVLIKGGKASAKVPLVTTPIAYGYMPIIRKSMPTPTLEPTVTPTRVPTATSPPPTITPTATIIIQPTQSAPGNCNTCLSNAYNCPYFSTQIEAQACFDYCMDQVGYDVHRLDGDDDGIACEWNP